MGIKCPKCKSTKTSSYASRPDEMHCRDCSHRWIPSKLRGGTWVQIGNGVTSKRKRVFVKAGYEIVYDILNNYKIVRKK
jgi:hypothetical protein